MRSPEHSRGAPRRAGKDYEEELHLHYLSPGAFTILPPEHVPPPDPPSAPAPYRLTPTSRRHRNQAFSIIAESNTASNSRSSSPSGRVSPFRGRGFNPSGSRHASPAPSPPPEDVRLTPSPRHTSKIPTLSRRGSHSAFGERVSHISSPRKRVFHSQLSQSLSSLDPKPPSIVNNKRPAGRNRNLAFQQLSPITGSSPEPSQSLSSPRISKSRSQPGSRITSPTRVETSTLGKPPVGSRIPSRTASRNVSRNPSRTVSREPSPNKNPISPTRIPINKYKNVQAKVNSHNAKPKVPPKPLVTTSDESDVPRPKLVKKDSVKKLRTPSSSRTNLLANNNVNNKSNNNNNNKIDKVNATIVRHPSNKTKTTTNNTNNNNNSVKKTVTNNSNNNKNSKAKTKEQTTSDSASDVPITSTTTTKEENILLPSTTAVVSSTTTTITQPLKIDAKIEPATIKYDKPKPVSPMVDGRVLSATSVSNAINKMNDTVLNTQTVMKEHGFSKLSPAANTIVSMANESKPLNPALDTKNATTELPTLDSKDSRPKENNNHVSSVGILDSRTLEQHVQNNMNRINHVATPDHMMGNSVQKSVNERMKEARTVVAADVKPIKIMVQGKPSDVEVQSGNVRLPVSATNGLSERPGLPPSNQTPPNEPENAKPPPKTNPCTRFFTTCKSKVPCKCLKKSETKNVETKEKDEDEEDQKTGCFNCRKKKMEPDQVRINIEPNETESEQKPKLMDRLKCCGRNKVSDTTGCFSKSKRKESWVASRRDSILSDPPPPRSKCKEFARKVFCLNLCCKKKPTIEEQMSRKASLMSKKKSLTPTTIPPPEEPKSKLDASLVEYSSHMKGAIPVLPVSLAWFCLVMNCIGPGTGTVLSGLFNLCLGIPRFSQKDGPKPRIGAFIINIFIGAGQFFTVLFCLVGWGWSIWWGVIMVKIAKKHRKIKQMELMEQQKLAEQNSSGGPSLNLNHHRDAERKS